MDPDTLASLRAQLEQEQGELEHQLKELGISPETGAVSDVEFEHGFADSGQATAEKARLLSVAESLLDTYREVKTALMRVEEGRFGKCESCGEEIPIERLEARPYARLCVRCKQRAS